MTEIREVRYWPGDTVDLVIGPRRDAFGEVVIYDDFQADLTVFDEDGEEVLSVEATPAPANHLHVHLSVDDTTQLGENVDRLWYRVRIDQDNQIVKTLQAGRITKYEVL